MARNWADLLPELLELCSRHLCPNDLRAFRAVCRSWRSAAPGERKSVPWLMLEDEADTAWREVFCLLCRRVHQVPVPEAKEKLCFTSRGWLFALDGWKTCMLKNPMSPRNRIIRLPDAGFASRFILSASPTTSPDYMVMAIHEFGGRPKLWKPGHEEWTAVNIPWTAVNIPSPGHDIWDVISYRACFVAIDCQGRILKCDGNGPTPFEAHVIFEMPRRLMYREQPNLVRPSTRYLLVRSRVYLVQSTTGLLLFVSRWRKGEYGRTFRFQVYQIDLNTQTCMEVKSLGNMSLFLGHNSSFSLESNEKHHIKPNCIYFPSWSWLSKERGMDMGIYHIEDCTIELYLVATDYHPFSCPRWIEPSF